MLGQAGRSTGVARTGDETPAHLPNDQHKTANCGQRGIAEEDDRTQCYPGISPPFEAFDRTTENRGVGGSSPPLAIPRPEIPHGDLIL